MEMTFEELQDKIEEIFNRKRQIEKSLKSCIETNYYKMAKHWIDELIILEEELIEISKTKII